MNHWNAWLTERSAWRIVTCGESHERIVLKHLISVVDELRLLDLHLVRQLIKRNQLETLHCLVSETVESHFFPGTLQFGWLASISPQSESSHTIDLYFEFNAQDVFSIFAIHLKASDISLTLKLLSFRQRADQRDALALLGHALEEARFKPRQQHSAVST